jgi:hypothetical protein
MNIVWFQSRLSWGAMLLAAGSALHLFAQPPAQPSFGQQLAVGRADYFKDIEGDRAADVRARREFTALAREQPVNPTVQAYLGSLDLLEAARTLAVWNKHALSQQGLRELDSAVEQDPSDLEARFIRAATTWHLPFFFHRREQAENDFAYIAPRAQDAVAKGLLPAALGAAALDYYGQMLSEKSDHAAARTAFEAAVRIDVTSPAGQDASRRLKRTD